MPKAYSGDLRERVVEAVASGASRREAAELYEIAAKIGSTTGAAGAAARARPDRSASPATHAQASSIATPPSLSTCRARIAGTHERVLEALPPTAFARLW